MGKQLDAFSKQKSQEFLERMRTEAVKLATQYGEVSADDIRERHEIPHGVDPNVLGSLFKGGQFIWKGVKKSRTPSRAGSMISVWALKERRTA